MTDNQLWVGNIPSFLSEEHALEELASYNIRPQKLVIRASTGAQDTVLSISFISYLRAGPLSLGNSSHNFLKKGYTYANVLAKQEVPPITIS